MFWLCYTLKILIVFNDSSHNQTEKVDKLNVIPTSKLCLGYIEYIQHVTPKEGQRPLVFRS